ncbi:putative allantoicase [Cardiosporidium cionae]|uniref:Allantoicase n=1 Tax=Cardiosporidium cionae TaxID=476202 RepID=A0A3Q8UBJ5_9APIC|nr:allantoicase [Cardiosporidium cionae]KAF8819267.1 putative allantoicase [Cardiosporidium cionae]|eukprot:KAF8819267.1 putative allantoicase [Cardiosporidium cionae]
MAAASSSLSQPLLSHETVDQAKRTRVQQSFDNTSRSNSKAARKAHNLSSPDTLDDERGNAKSQKRYLPPATSAPPSNGIIKRFWRWLTEYRGPPSILLPAPPKQTFCNFANLADKQFGSEIMFVSDDFFGSAENILRSDEPSVVEPPHLFGHSDGWITRRRREIGHDWCIIQLGFPGTIYGIEINLTNMEVESVPRLSIEGVYCSSLSYASLSLPPLVKSQQLTFEQTDAVDKAIERHLHQSFTDWIEILDSEQACFTNLKQRTSRSFFFSVEDPLLKQDFTHLRINLFPDGGIARFRAFGQAGHFRRKIDSDVSKDLIPLLSPKYGGNLLCFDSTTLLHGHPKEIIIIENARKLGWETTRKLDRPPIINTTMESKVSRSGDWAIFRFQGCAIIDSICITAAECVGRIPRSILIEGIDIRSLCLTDILEEQRFFEKNGFVHSKAMGEWKMLAELSFPINEEMVVYSNLKERSPHWSSRMATHIRVILIPDGGISSIRITGVLLT